MAKDQTDDTEEPDVDDDATEETDEDLDTEDGGDEETDDEETDDTEDSDGSDDEDETDDEADGKDKKQLSMNERLKAAIETRVKPKEQNHQRALCAGLSGEMLETHVAMLEAENPFHWLDAQALEAAQKDLKACNLSPGQKRQGAEKALMEMKKASLSNGRYSPGTVSVGGKELDCYSVMLNVLKSQPKASYLDSTPLAGAGSTTPAETTASIQSGPAAEIDDARLKAKYPESF